MIGIFPHPYIHGHLYKILSASITASVAMSSLHHWFIAAILIGGPVSGFLLENGHRPNIIFLVADDLGECWLGSTYLSIATKPAEFRILYNVSGCLCGAVGRGLACQSRWWQIKFRLCQID